MRGVRLAVALGAAALCTTVMAQQPPAQPAGQPPSLPLHRTTGHACLHPIGSEDARPGQHDYPQFLADWSKILTERGAIVDGSLHSPDGGRARRTPTCSSCTREMPAT